MAPRLTFVLVAHREQAFLEPCLASILGQDVPDLEVVAIDDASGDHVPELLDAAARSDPRVRVHHLAERAGRGAARNLGLDQAQGEYVWFVRTTDLLVGGALPGVVERLGEQPDVLLLQHLRESPTGRRRPAPRQTGVGDASPHVFDKLLRREAIAQLRFGERGYDELSVIWPALLTAQRLAVHNEPAYICRHPPNAVRTGTPWDALDQYEALGDRGPQLRAAILRHGTALSRRLPAGERRAYLERVARLAGAGRPRLLAREAARAGQERLGRERTALKRRLRQATDRDPLRRHYRARLREPLDPDLAVFAAYWYRGYSCNPRAIHQRARELKPNLRGVWVVKEGATVPDGVEHVVAGTEAYYDAIARATYFVNNVNFPDHVVKRDGQIHVMTHHGTPLKKMGMDLADMPGKRNLAGVLRRCRRWDYSVSANPFSTLVWERAYPTRYETLETGYPRNDVLANATAETVRAARAALGIADGQTAVLYAPTHREYSDDPTPPLDLAAFADGLGPEHVVMARLHYFHDEHPMLRELHGAGRIRDVASHPSVEELCLAADLLVTDYSSIMFDYAVLDRPIVIHAPDWEVYREQRGTYFDLLSGGPGPVGRTGDEVLELVRSGGEAPRAAFRERFCSLDDGRAAERVVRAVFG
jgi:CDP-glycerol glycerophosphotransferase (TagB/SpsB family)